MRLSSLAKGTLVAAALAFATVSAEARPHGGGGHGGGHGGGFHGGSFHGGGFHGGGYRGYAGHGYYGRGFAGRGYYGRGYYGHGLYGRGYYGGGWGWGGWGYPFWDYGWGGYPLYGYGDYYPSYTDTYPSYDYFSYPDYYDSPDYAYGLGAGDYLSAYPPDSGGSATPAATTAVIHVNTAPDAKLWFNGAATSQTGPQRTFTTPPLQPGKKYEYHVRVRLTQNGHTLDTTRTVDVTPGTSSDVDLTPSALGAQ